MIIFINLSNPTDQHDSRPTERPTQPTGDAFLSRSCIFEPCYQLTNGFRHLKKVETKHHSVQIAPRFFRWNTPDTSRWRFAGETRASNALADPAIGFGGGQIGEVTQARVPPKLKTPRIWPTIFGEWPKITYKNKNI